MRVAVVLVCFWAGVSQAQEPLRRAVAAIEQGDFDSAPALLEAALEDPGNSRADLARVYLYVAFVDNTLGRTESTRRALDAAVALEPNIEAAEMMPRSFRARLREAREARDASMFGIMLSADGRVARVDVQNAPEGMVGTLVLASGEWSVERPAPGPWRVEVPESVHDGEAAALVRARLMSPVGVEVATGSLEMPYPGPRLELRVASARALTLRAARPEGLAAVRVGVDGDPGWSTELEPPGPWEVEVPTDVYGDAEVVNVWAEAMVEDGSASQRLGVDVPRETESRGALRNPWFWTAIGVVLAGGAAGVAIWARRGAIDFEPQVDIAWE